MFNVIKLIVVNIIVNMKFFNNDVRVWGIVMFDDIV